MNITVQVYGCSVEKKGRNAHKFYEKLGYDSYKEKGFIKNL